jgi:hypothetical protein
MSETEMRFFCLETNKAFATHVEAIACAARFREIQRACDEGLVPDLRPGDIIYVDTSLYVSHGVDDFRGGLAEVAEFAMQKSAGKPTPFVKVNELIDTWQNWQMLAADQRKLRAEFSRSWAHPDPDHRLEFNQW